MAFLSPEHLIEHMALAYGSHVAEFGAGSGAYIGPLARAVGSSGKVYAVDIDRRMLDHVVALADREKLIQVDIVYGDIERGTTLPSYTLDGAVVSNTLSQSSHRKEFLTHVIECLKPGAPLLLVDWSASHGGAGPHPDHLCTSDEAQKLIQDAGLRVVTRLPAGDYHWAMICN